jgi:hypothetical protein
MLMLMEYVVIGINVEHAITSRGLIMIRDYNSNFMHVLRSRYVAFEQLLWIEKLIKLFLCLRSHPHNYKVSASILPAPFPTLIGIC